MPPAFVRLELEAVAVGLEAEAGEAMALLLNVGFFRTLRATSGRSGLG
jgi:hypothetical protein